MLVCYFMAKTPQVLSEVRELKLIAEEFRRGVKPIYKNNYDKKCIEYAQMGVIRAYLCQNL